jgi:hypothetical protein
MEQGPPHARTRSYPRRARRSGPAFHGRFHTFARKLDGHWRFAVDDDTNDGGTVTAETFTAGAEIDDVDAFAG